MSEQGEILRLAVGKCRICSGEERALILGPVHTIRAVAPGAKFFEFKERGVTHTGCLLATIDAEIGKIVAGASGWKRAWGHPSFSPLTVDPPQPSGSASSDPMFACNASALAL